MENGLNDSYRGGKEMFFKASSFAIMIMDRIISFNEIFLIDRLFKNMRIKCFKMMVYGG